MSSIEPECQLNTTECILKAAVSILGEVKDANGEYNWDPLTFVVTLVIGIIALFFAGLTIGQGLLAAGPGRHRCGRYALGPWASLTQRKFDWGELRYRTTAFTPIISHVATDADIWPNLGQVTNEDEGHQRDKNVQGSSKSISEYFPATWLALLTLVDADDTRLWPQKATGADYMPTDLAAAPAFATILDVVALACVADYPEKPKLRIDAETNLPSVQSTKFELAFRTHPMLGAFGLFQIYNPELSLPKADKEGPKLGRHYQIKLTFLYACGHLTSRFYTEGVDYHTMASTPLIKAHRQHCTSFAECFFGCDCREKGSITCCGMPDLHVPTWCHGGSLHAFYVFFLETSPATIMSAAYFRFPPLAFPNKALRTRWRALQLLPLSRLWSLDGEGLHALEGTDQLRSEDAWKLIRHDMQVWEAQFPKVEGLRAKDLDLGKEWYTCRAFCQNRRDKEGMVWSKGDQTFMRARLHTAMTNIDGWLDRFVPGSVFRCRVLSLSMSAAWCERILDLGDKYNGMSSRQNPPGVPSYRDLEFISRNVDQQVCDILDNLGVLTGEKPGYKAEDQEMLKTQLLRSHSWKQISDHYQHSIRKSMHELVKIFQMWELKRESSDNSKPKFKMPRTAQHPLDDLLIYRTLLYAVMLEVATDVSDVRENDDCNRIIPIL